MLLPLGALANSSQSRQSHLRPSSHPACGLADRRPPHPVSATLAYSPEMRLAVHVSSQRASASRMLNSKERYMRYDLIVVGSGPAGQKAAIAAAKQNWRVAVVERKQELLGGVSLHTGTIPSKTIREAILHLTGYRHRDVYEESYRRKREITMDDLRLMIRNVNQTEWQVLQDQFARNRVNVVCGEASFVDPHHIEVAGRGETQILEGRHILLAPGTRPSRPEPHPVQRRNGLRLRRSPRAVAACRVR